MHQTEGPAGSAHAMAKRQAANPKVRGVTLWVETDGTVVLVGAGDRDPDCTATAPTATTTSTSPTSPPTATSSTPIRSASSSSAIFPTCESPRPSSRWRPGWCLVKFLQERYGIPVEQVYAHNWIDYKDHRYCEGCELAQRARRARTTFPAIRKPKPALRNASLHPAVDVCARARPFPEKPQTSPQEWPMRPLFAIAVTLLVVSPWSASRWRRSSVCRGSGRRASPSDSASPRRQRRRPPQHRSRLPVNCTNLPFGDPPPQPVGLRPSPQGACRLHPAPWSGRTR